MAKDILRLLVVSSLMWMHTSSPIRDTNTATETLTDAMVNLLISSICYVMFGCCWIFLPAIFNLPDIPSNYLSFEQGYHFYNLAAKDSKRIIILYISPLSIHPIKVY